MQLTPDKSRFIALAMQKNPEGHNNWLVRVSVVCQRREAAAHNEV